MITIVPTQPAHAAQVAQHQRICFPTLVEHELFSEADVLAQIAVFPAGQHVALDGARVVGQSSTFRCRSERVFAPHEFDEIIGGGTFSNHDPQGEWLYGADMSVHPDYRRRGIASRLYDARKALIRQLGLRGIVAGGMLPDYRLYRAQMSVEAFVAAVVAGTLHDATLTPQLRNGFRVERILYDHIHAGALGPHAALIVWESPDWPGSTPR